MEFVEDDIGLAGYLFLWKYGMKDQLGQQIQCPPEMLDQEDRIDKGFLFGSVSIQFAAYRFHAVEDVTGEMLVGSLKDHVLHEMRQSMLVGLLVACAGLNRKPAVPDGRGRRQMHQPQAVR